MARITAWWNAPIAVPRWAFTVMYVLFIIIGSGLLVAGSIPLDEISGPIPRIVWAGVVVASSLVAALGSVAPRMEPLERWSSVVLTLAFIFYAVVALSTGRSGGVLIVLLAVILPGSRALSLLPRTGIHHDR